MPRGERVALRRRCPRPLQRIRPDFTGADAGEGLQQLRLAVAGDAGDAHDLAAPHREADALDALDAEGVLDHEVADLEHRARRAGPAALSTRRRPGGRPSARRAARTSSPAVGSVATTRPWRITVTTSVTSRISRSLWVMRTTVLPSSRERPEDAEEVVGLLGREDGGRLVEDQEVGAAVERLQDLDALALAHAEIGDARVGVDLEVVLAPEPRELGAGARQPGPEPEAALDAEHDVLQDRERLHQHEVLVHHADPRRQRVLRAADGRRPAVAPGSRRGRDGGSRTGCPSGSTCRRRSRRRCRGSFPRARRARRRGWRGPRRTTCRCRGAR